MEELRAFQVRLGGIGEDGCSRPAMGQNLGLQIYLVSSCNERRPRPVWNT